MSSDEHGLPYGEVDAKRSWDKVPVQFDWHDYLAIPWQPGKAWSLGSRWRPRRAQATGFEYEATTAGVSGRRPPTLPTTDGASVRDGSVVFTARPISNASLRATVQTSSFPTVEGVTLSDESDSDLVYTVYVDGGTSGEDYEIVHRVTLSNAPGEEKEGVALLPVRD